MSSDKCYDSSDRPGNEARFTATTVSLKKSRQISVMIVEDSRVVREFLEHIISRDPRFRIVSSVGSGEEALRSIPRAAPDVISMDIRLPGMNGLELTKRIMH